MGLLQAAAEAGDLDDVEGLREVVRAMIADPRARRGIFGPLPMIGWSSTGSWRSARTPRSSPYFSPDVGMQAREETLRLA